MLLAITMESVMTYLARPLRRTKVPVVGIFLFSLCGSVYFSLSSIQLWKNEWIIEDEAFLPIFEVAVPATAPRIDTSINHSKANHYDQTTTQEQPLNTTNTTAVAKIFYERHLESINSLVNVSTALTWQARWKDPFQPFKQALGNPLLCPGGKSRKTLSRITYATTRVSTLLCGEIYVRPPGPWSPTATVVTTNPILMFSSRA